MTAASLEAVGELVEAGVLEKLNLGANDLAECGSPDQCDAMRTVQPGCFLSRELDF